MSAAYGLRFVCDWCSAEAFTWAKTMNRKEPIQHPNAWNTPKGWGADGWGHHACPACVHIVEAYAAERRKWRDAEIEIGKPLWQAAQTAIEEWKKHNPEPARPDPAALAASCARLDARMRAAGVLKGEGQS